MVANKYAVLFVGLEAFLFSCWPLVDQISRKSSKQSWTFATSCPSSQPCSPPSSQSSSLPSRQPPNCQIMYPSSIPSSILPSQPTWLHNQFTWCTGTCFPIGDILLHKISAFQCCLMLENLSSCSVFLRDITNIIIPYFPHFPFLSFNLTGQVNETCVRIGLGRVRGKTVKIENK